MIIVTKENFKAEVEDFSGLAVLDLYADWCGPCRMLAPILEQLEGEYPEVNFCKINVDEQPELAKEFNVSSIPMVAFVKGDVFIDLHVGLASKRGLQEKIEANK